MNFLDLSLPYAKTVIINFPGRPITHQIEPVSHLGLHDKYRDIGKKIQQTWIGFIGCQQRYHNHEIVAHTSACLGALAEQMKDKMVIIMGSSAWASGVLASPIARTIASGMLLFNTNPYHLQQEFPGNTLTKIPWWIDFYNSKEGSSSHAQWAEEIASEAQTENVTQRRIDGTELLSAEQAFEWVLMSLRSRNYLE